jgi:hypothetical protein
LFALVAVVVCFGCLLFVLWLLFFVLLGCLLLYFAALLGYLLFVLLACCFLFCLAACCCFACLPVAWLLFILPFVCFAWVPVVVLLGCCLNSPKATLIRSRTDFRKLKALLISSFTATTHSHHSQRPLVHNIISHSHHSQPPLTAMIPAILAAIVHNNGNFLFIPANFAIYVLQFRVSPIAKRNQFQHELRNNS